MRGSIDEEEEDDTLGAILFVVLLLCLSFAKILYCKMFCVSFNIMFL